MHSKKAWQCGGCDKIFSRRDAIRRHKNTRKLAGEKFQACVDGQVIEVAAETNDSERVERSAKFWNEISEHEPAPVASTGYESTVEDGELDQEMLVGVQSDVESLHGLLQAHALNALGTPPTTSGGQQQLTLADVIARAQLLASTPTPGGGDPADANRESSAATSASNGANASETAGEESATSAAATLSVYGLSDEQTKMLEMAIASAASAAHAQAEAEAALEEDEDGYEDEEEEEEEEEPADKKQ